MSRFTLRKLNNNGFTLLEIIISIAIIGIISVVFLSVFASGLINIFSAGHRSKGAYYGQQALENKIAGNPAAVPNTTVITTTGQSIQLTFPGITLINIDGSIQCAEYNDGKRIVDVTFFKHD